ncbi:hypothetical protein V22_16240 [Calycomorphotria hydatis]|uniref:Glycosyltransferase RgtA/B/C/D-like domain-containing protein n=2 Tax=Calycomorphotria hydatis TaxID=2528027 RepID=A0A517T7Q9_9PLAN|nr:hypothetical protein V22_16240 [Calycomorphotria hydatis]
MLLVFAACFPIIFLWGTSIPLGVPGEWTWTRLQDPLLLSIASAIPALLCLACYLFFVRQGRLRIERAGTVTQVCWLSGLVAAGFLFLWYAQQAPIEPQYQLGKGPLVLYYPASSGYFTLAREHQNDLGSFLANYETTMSEGDVLHVGTHPPGLVILYSTLRGVFEQLPILKTLVLKTVPDSARMTLDLIKEFSTGGPDPFTEVDSAVLWGMVLLTQFAAALTVVPLYFLCLLAGNRPASFTAAALWPLVPSVSLFLPKSDLLLPVLAMAFLACWFWGRERRSVLLAGLAGLCAWSGLMISLAFLPIGVIVVVAELISLWEKRGEWLSMLTPLLLRCGVAAAVILLLTLCYGLITQSNLFAIWYWNYHNHAGFYDEYTRTYWAWLLVNPLELWVAAGGALLLLAILGMCKALRSDEPLQGRSILFGALLVWGLLWVSGKNSGEAARLWILLMPLLCMWACPYLDAKPRAGEVDILATSRWREVSWWVVISLQGIAAVLTVTRVTGFHFGET